MTTFLSACAITVLGLGPQDAQETRPARDESGEARAFVEVEASVADRFVGQRVSLTLEFGIESGFLESSMVQPFGVRLDVPVQVTWSGVDIPAAEGSGRATFAWNEVVRGARRTDDRIVSGRTYRSFAAEAEIFATTPGSLAIPAPVLTYAYATRFEEGFLAGRVPADRVDAFVSGRALELRVSALPEAGRPPEFSGAVGSFTAEAEASPRALNVGQSLRLLLRIRGRGNFDSIEVPRWKEIGGFRVLGIVDERSPDARTFSIDLSPYSAEVWQIPAIPFAYFDPEEPAGYRIARTEAIGVEVRSAASAAPLPTSDERRPRTEGVNVGWWLAGAGALVGLIVWASRRRAGQRGGGG